MLYKTIKEEYGYLFSKKMKYVFWGAANTGFESIARWDRFLNIKKVVDGDKLKHGGAIRGVVVGEPELKADDETILVVTCQYFGAIRPLAEKMGFVHGKTLFSHLDFERLFLFLSHDYLLSNRIDISLTERCTLKCAGCNMWMPYFKTPGDQPVKMVKNDLDAYFGIVHRVRQLNLLGGEPFLYHDFGEIVDYIGSAYRDRIGLLHIFTNGAVSPDEGILDKLVQYDATLSITDYRSFAPGITKKYDAFLRRCEERGVKIAYNSATSWANFGFPANPPEDASDAASAARFRVCSPDWRGLYNGRVYFCHLESSAERAGLFRPESRDYVELGADDKDIRDKFLAFDLGFVEGGFLSFCRVCRGCAGNPISIKVGVQV